MLITKNFIVINNPKTGSSFIRQVLKEIYAQQEQKYSWFRRKSIAWKLTSPELVELFMRPINTKSNTPKSQHGEVNQIPKKYKNKAIVSVVRNPYTAILSNFEFGFWKENIYLFVDKNIIKDKFPQFPNISIEEFIDLKKILNNQSYPNLRTAQIGFQTIKFIEMFFNNPLKIIATINDDYILSGAYKKDLKPITFLKQENLTEDLISFLSQYDFTAKELEMIRNYKKINVTKNKTSNRMALHTPKSLDYIQTYERLLFKIYEDLGIFYEAP